MTAFTLTLVPTLGGSLGTATATVTIHNYSTLASIYSDPAMSGPMTNPIALTSNTISFYANIGTGIDITLSGGNIPRADTILNAWSVNGSTYPIGVTSVQNVGQMYTANDLIRGAMRLIQVSAVDVDLTAAELADGLECLNRMLDSWSADELTLYQVIREQFLLQSSMNPYTIGYGGTWDTTRPTKVVGAYLTLTNASGLPVDYPMAVLGYDDYNSIRLKTLSTNFPNYMYYQPSFPLGEVYIYPVFSPNANQTNASITLTSWKPFDCITDPTAYLSLPPGFWEALVQNLATRLALEFQFEVRSDLIQLAASSAKRLKRMNTRTVTLQTDPALFTPQAQSRYNIFGDTYK
jgi:hypothetical protein